jgi:hypothetical protein
VGGEHHERDRDHAAGRVPAEAGADRVILHLLWILFGPGAWGTGGNMVAWVICGALGFGWLHSKEKARHLARMTQAARHQKELLDQAAEHHEDMKRHVTETIGDNGSEGR